METALSGWPHAPWWQPEEGHPASVTATGLIAGRLHALDVRHPWIDRATEVMWTRIGRLARSGGELPDGPGGGYEMFGVLGFPQHVPDRDRAREAFGRVGPLILDRHMVALDPATPGEVHFPLDFAPEPDSLARELFDEATIKGHLNHLAQAQREDSGWTFIWLAWSPAAERDWRGVLTVDALRVLRANGRWRQRVLTRRAWGLTRGPALRAAKRRGPQTPWPKISPHVGHNRTSGSVGVLSCGAPGYWES